MQAPTIHQVFKAIHTSINSTWNQLYLTMAESQDEGMFFEPSSTPGSRVGHTQFDQLKKNQEHWLELRRIYWGFPEWLQAPTSDLRCQWVKGSSTSLIKGVIRSSKGKGKLHKGMDFKKVKLGQASGYELKQLACFIAALIRPLRSI